MVRQRPGRHENRALLAEDLGKGSLQLPDRAAGQVAVGLDAAVLAELNEQLGVFERRQHRSIGQEMDRPGRFTLASLSFRRAQPQSSTGSTGSEKSATAN